MNEKYQNAMGRLNGICCALDCLDDPLKTAAENSAAAQGVRSIILALGAELNHVYTDLAEFGKGVGS
jgi:hypothetical protein